MTREGVRRLRALRPARRSRLVTRLSHSRTNVQVGEMRGETALQKAPKAADTWVLLPGNARGGSGVSLVARQKDVPAWSGRRAGTCSTCAGPHARRHHHRHRAPTTTARTSAR